MEVVVSGVDVGGLGVNAGHFRVNARGFCVNAEGFGVNAGGFCVNVGGLGVDAEEVGVNAQPSGEAAKPYSGGGGCPEDDKFARKSKGFSLVAFPIFPIAESVPPCDTPSYPGGKGVLSKSDQTGR